ncbi:MAG: UvrD-helicase domain-containing protein [Dehalococcoidia bacterium]
MFAARRGFTEAAAGCGKTQLLSSIVADERFGRQLILTHTHAGVAALRKRLRKRGVAETRFHLDTIAGWCLRWATAYPSISGVAVDPAAQPAWSAVYVGSRKVVATSLARQVLAASYEGVLIDEYQDCTQRQHEVIAAIGEALPCRGVGDDLQAIFDFGHERVVGWDVVKSYFSFQPPLEHPWRWQQHGCNSELGEWLTDARRELQTQGRLTIARDAPVRWVARRDQSVLVQACRGVVRNGETAVGIGKITNRDCIPLAKSLGRGWPVVEVFDHGDLPKCAKRLATADGRNAVAALVEFLKPRVTKAYTEIQGMMQTVRDGKDTNRIRKHKDHFARMKALADSPSPEAALALVDGIVQHTGWWLYRPECVRQLQTALREVSGGTLADLPEAVAAARTRARHRGRVVPMRCLGTPLLVKGLEFDHAVVMNPEELTVRELYVAITRGSKSLTIVAKSRVIAPKV